MNNGHKNGNLNILITAASRRVALVKHFQRAVSENGHRGKVVATDTDSYSPALSFVESHHLVPLSSSPDYLDRILAICKKEKIRLVVPTIDEELPLFGHFKSEFEKEEIRVLVSDKKVGEICNDKYLTYKFFAEHGFPMAPTYLPREIDVDRVRYPLFIKPRTGRGSVGAHRINNERELRFFLDYVPDPVVQPFLPGREFTIDVLSDFQGRVISVVPRERLVIRSGVCDRGKTVKHPRLMELGGRIAEALNILGPANFQCKIDGEEITFFEVNPRFSGAIQLTVAAGADFFRWIVEMMNGGDLRPQIGEFTDGLLMSSYEESVYRQT
jgi:carbamoyl-phosphate synthase large subunit